MTETNLVARATDALRQMGLHVTVLKAPRGVRPTDADAWLRIGHDRKGAGYLVAARRAVTPPTVGALLAQLRDRAAATGWPTLLVAERLTPPVADTLRQQQQQFADTAGNAYLTGPGLLVHVAGRKLQLGTAGMKPDQVFTNNGLKILFAMLCDPALAQAPQRTLAAAAGVALGAVPGVLKDLQAGGHLLTLAKRRRLNTTKRLLDEWALAYARRLRPRTLQATYTTPNLAAWVDWKLNPVEVRWGGEPAAALLTNYLRPGNLTLYTERLPPRLMVEQRLTRTDRPGRDGIVEVRRPFWGASLLGDAPRPDIVPPVLVYADLLATGDGRCIETAQMLYDDYLIRLFPAA
jgi:hypothetical protein